MIELWYFSLDQWEVKIHLLWGKSFHISHSLRSHLTYGRLQHIEYFSKSKTEQGMVWLKWLILETIHGVHVNCSYQPASIDLTESSVPCFFSIFKIKIFISLLLVVLIVLLEISPHGYWLSLVFWLGSKAPTSGPRLRIFKGWQKSDSFWLMFESPRGGRNSLKVCKISGGTWKFTSVENFLRTTNGKQCSR